MRWILPTIVAFTAVTSNPALAFKVHFWAETDHRSQECIDQKRTMIRDFASDGRHLVLEGLTVGNDGPGGMNEAYLRSFLGLKEGQALPIRLEGSNIHGLEDPVAFSIGLMMAYLSTLELEIHAPGVYSPIRDDHGFQSVLNDLHSWWVEPASQLLPISVSMDQLLARVTLGPGYDGAALLRDISGNGESIYRARLDDQKIVSLGGKPLPHDLQSLIGLMKERFAREAWKFVHEKDPDRYPEFTKAERRRFRKKYQQRSLISSVNQFYIDYARVKFFTQALVDLIRSLKPQGTSEITVVFGAAHQKLITDLLEESFGPSIHIQASVCKRKEMKSFEDRGN